MKCFSHQDKDAVGICNACGKGVCADCAIDLDHSIVCKSSCEEKVNLIDSTFQESEEKLDLLDSAIEQNMITMQASKRNRFISPAFCAVMGSVFIYFGIERYPQSKLGLMIGLGFLVFAVINFFVLQKWARELDVKNESSSS